MEQDDGVVIADGTIAEKLWTDEREVVCWHYDHAKGQMVKGINLLNMLYPSRDVSVPVAFEVIRKPLLLYCDLNTHQIKRAGLMTKSELMREMIAACLTNQLKFRYVLMDSWFAAHENFEFIVKKGMHFIAALKDNRLVPFSEEDRKHKRFERIDHVSLSEKKAVHGWRSRAMEKKCSWGGKLLQTRTAARASRIWCAAIWPSMANR